MRNCHGAGMVDAMIALLLLAMAGLIFSATYPSGFSAVRQARETKKAVALAQQKLEQVKSLGYESITYTSLRALNAVDISPTSSPYEFTSVDDLTSSLASATGTLTVVDDTASVKRVTVVINWDGGKVDRSVTMRTLIADTRAWKAP